MIPDRGDGGAIRRRAPGNADHSPEFVIIRCVDWLRSRGETVNQELWDGVLELSRTAKRPSVRLRAAQLLLDRIDPIPRGDVASAGPISVNVIVTNQDVGADGHAEHAATPDGTGVRTVNRDGPGT